MGKTCKSIYSVGSDGSCSFMYIKSLFTSCHQSKLAEESKTSCCLHVRYFSPWIPALQESLVTQSRQLLKCLPLWSKWVLNIFLSLLHQQVIHPPESHLSPHVGTLKLRILALANLEMSFRGPQPASILVEIIDIRNINRQWTLQPVLLSPWKYFVLDFLDDLCYLPEKQILPHAPNKLICVILMFEFRAVSLPVLSCLVSLGVGWAASWYSESSHTVRSEHYYFLVITAV